MVSSSCAGQRHVRCFDDEETNKKTTGCTEISKSRKFCDSEKTDFPFNERARSNAHEAPWFLLKSEKVPGTAARVAHCYADAGR
ncbi:MAG: hypothetical protein ACK4WC_00700 [Rubrimonas sp.]